MSLSIEENISLKNLHTFHIEVNAKFYCKIKHYEEIFELIEYMKNPLHTMMILGEGSDVLFTKDFNGLIVHDSIKGIEKVYENEDYVWIKANSGENWHELVSYCVELNWGGIENLALIPGNAGAAPIQNIGAYGVEIKDVLHSIEAVDLKSGEELIFMNEELEFDYRWSIFKKPVNKGRYYINSITLKLAKNPEINLKYKDVEEEITSKTPNIKNVFDAIVAIRTRKLPDPNEIGNAGSFFKNPVIDQKQYDELIKTFPDLKSYPSKNGIKLPAAQLIDLCGWKNIKRNHVGVFKNQALVIVNFGNAKGMDVYNFSKEIQLSVKEKFGVQLEPEVNIVD